MTNYVLPSGWAWKYTRQSRRRHAVNTSAESLSTACGAYVRRYTDWRTLEDLSLKKDMPTCALCARVIRVIDPTFATDIDSWKK